MALSRMLLEGVRASVGGVRAELDRVNTRLVMQEQENSSIALKLRCVQQLQRSQHFCYIST